MSTFFCDTKERGRGDREGATHVTHRFRPEIAGGGFHFGNGVGGAARLRVAGGRPDLRRSKASGRSFPCTVKMLELGEKIVAHVYSSLQLERVNPGSTCSQMDFVRGLYRNTVDGLGSRNCQSDEIRVAIRLRDLVAK
ncbi:hypothetical protein B296_00022697 [Ensete ventricosum]|uniref:Uncharacterized protein n=1 Tax=Ensete ventricosum TaxID=4639 RepID=A0A427AH00_ENSVE|nr:hypothetical protein B296_00022697 [Ensete ventricosum]